MTSLNYNLSILLSKNYKLLSLFITFPTISNSKSVINIPIILNLTITTNNITQGNISCNNMIEKCRVSIIDRWMLMIKTKKPGKEEYPKNHIG